MDYISRAGDASATTALSKVFKEGYLKDLEASMDKETFERDWHNIEKFTCEMCKGTGKNLMHLEDDHCVNCEGTGVNHTLHYGVKSKQTFAYVEEYGLEAKKEYCKAMREAFIELQMAGKVSEKHAIVPYGLPKVVEMELIALGYNPNGAQGAEVREIANWVAKNCPEYLCVPYTKF